MNPLVHYLRYGAWEGRKPHPLFDPRYYARSYGDPDLEQQAPLIHFLETKRDWANPHPLFNCRIWLTHNPDAASSGINPLVHYVRSGADVRPCGEGAYAG